MSKWTIIACSATVICAVAAVIGVFIMWEQLGFISEELQREIANREKIERVILAREPNVDYLKPFIQAAEESFWVVVPIINKSTSASAVGHRVQVSITFGTDNLIKEIDADPFVVVSGWEGGHSANLELSVLYPGTVIYISFLVEKGQLPEEIAIGWAEKTGLQSIPLKVSP